MRRIAPRPPEPPAARLEVRDLRVVLALAAAGTTAKAAAVLHLTQPAVSRALLGVEDRVGVRLFDRTPRGLAPTAAGARLVAGARAVLDALGDLEERVRGPAAAPLRLRLVCECYTAYHWLPSALADLERSLPGLELTLGVEHTAAPVRALERGDIDAALLTTAPVPAGRLDEAPLFADEIVFLVAPGHPLADRAALTRADLVASRLLTSTAPPAESRWFMRQVFGRARPRLELERLPLTEAIVDLARAGAGVAVLSEWMASPHLGKGDLVAKRLRSGPLERPWRLAWRREVGDAALRLAAALRSAVPRAGYRKKSGMSSAPGTSW